MHKDPQNKKFIALAVVFFCAAAIYGTKLVKGARGPAPAAILPRAAGNPQAPLRIVEYMDFQCPACARGALFLDDLLKKKPAEVYLEVKYFPLEGTHRHAVRSARYAECAAQQGKFWEAADLLFKKQSEWKDLINADPVFEEISRSAQLDFNKLNVCLANETTTDAIVKDKQEGQSRGVRSTPTYFVNDKMVVGLNSLEGELMDFFGRVKH
jgi:protein-disulfide isomerase